MLHSLRQFVVSKFYFYTHLHFRSLGPQGKAIGLISVAAQKGSKFVQTARVRIWSLRTTDTEI
jgi:hypothetical protein